MKTKNTIQIVETPDIDSHDFYANNGVINPAFLSTGDDNDNPQPPEPPHRQQHQHQQQHQDYYQYQNIPNPHPKQHSLHRQQQQQQHPSTGVTTTTTGAADYRQTYFRPTVTNPYGNGSSIASSWVYEFNNGSSVGTNSNTSSPSTGTTYTGEYIGMMSGPTTTGATLPSIHRPSYGRYDPHLAYDMDLTRDHKLNGGGAGSTGADGSHGSNGQCCRTMLRLFVWALILVSLMGILISVAFIIYVEKFAPHQPNTGAVQCCGSNNSSISSAGVTGAAGGRDRLDRNITEPSVVSMTAKKAIDNKGTTVPALSTSRLVPTPAPNATVKATLSPVEPRFSIQTHMTTAAPVVNDSNMTTTGLSLNTTTGANTTAEPLLPTTNGTDISTGGDVSDGTGSTATTVTTITTTTAAPVVNITIGAQVVSSEMVVDSTEHEFIITSTGTTTTTTPSLTISTSPTTTTTSAPIATGTTIIKPIETTIATIITNSTAPVDIPQLTTTTSTTPVPTTTTTTTTPSPAIGVKETTAADYTGDYYERADTMGANETTTEHNYAADNGAQQDLFNAFT